MKTWKQRIACILIVCCSAPLIVCGQYRQRGRTHRSSRNDNYHFMYVSLGAGYTGISENAGDLSTTGGWGGLAGLGYEFRRTHFWMSIGGQVQLHNSRSELSSFTDVQKGLDTQHDRKSVTLHYTFYEKDEQKLSFVDVPMLLGYYYNGFYVGVGGKVSFALSSKVTNGGTYDLLCEYDEYVGMPSIPIENNRFSGEKEVKMNVGGSLIGEIGYDVLATQRTRGSLCNVLKIGFYFEYGLNNFFPGDKDLKRVSFPHTNANGEIIATEPQVNPYYALKHDNVRIVPYYLGVKLTYMIGGSRTGGTGTWHRGCQCYE